MADRQQPGPGPLITRQTRSDRDGSALLRRIQERSPNSTQVLGFLTLMTTGAILLLLTGLTVTAAVTGLVLFAPIVVLTSPVWVPAAVVVFVAATAALWGVGAAVAGVAAGTWVYRYSTGRQPVGSGRVDYARTRIADTAREYGGYLQSRIKDAAPGA